MGNRVMKWEGDDRWGVYQSTSEAMYAPIFGHELDAEIFAGWYEDNKRFGINVENYTDEFQMRLASDIRMFLDEAFGTHRLGDRYEDAPKAWQDRFLDEGGESPVSYDSDVVDWFQRDEEGMRSFVFAEFFKWQKASKEANHAA